MIRTRSYVTRIMVASCALSACATFASHKNFNNHLNASQQKCVAASLKSVNPFALPSDVENASFQTDPYQAISTLKHANKIAHKTNRQEAQEKRLQKAFLSIELPPIQEDNLSDITLDSDGEFTKKSNRLSAYSNEEEGSDLEENGEEEEEEEEGEGELDYYEEQVSYGSDDDADTPNLSPRARQQVEFLKNRYPSKDWDSFKN